MYKYCVDCLRCSPKLFESTVMLIEKSTIAIKNGPCIVRRAAKKDCIRCSLSKRIKKNSCKHHRAALKKEYDMTQQDLCV